jgi:hypothetical protein
MRAGEDEFGLRLAAKAADRATAARLEWPAFEKRLRDLGYGPREIAHAFFSTLSGPGSVAEALEVLKGMSRAESPPIALSFKVTETGGRSLAATSVTITSVERDDSVILVNYDVVPPPELGSHRARCEAKDDLGNDYADLGGHFGITGIIDSTDRASTRARGRLKMPLPPPAATMLRIRIRFDASGVIRMPWDASLSSIWERPAHEVQVSLPE